MARDLPVDPWTVERGHKVIAQAIAGSGLPVRVKLALIDALVDECTALLTRRSVRKSLPAELRQQIYRRDQDRCCYCGVSRRDPQGASLSVDHIDPLGPDFPWNLVTACRGCNSLKGQRTPEEAEMRLLRDPRVDTMAT